MSNTGKDTLRRVAHRITALLGIRYTPKRDSYWFLLAIPELLVLIFILYLCLMVMVRHTYHYFAPDETFEFPGVSVIYAITGEKNREESLLDGAGLERDLIQSVLKVPSGDLDQQFHFVIHDSTDAEDDMCSTCHGDLPHTENAKVRTELNMHTEFIACSTCHTTLEQARSRHYTWTNHSGVDVTGEPFGTRYDEQGGLKRTDDHYSRIAPYLNTNGQKQLIGIVRDTSDARSYLLVGDRLSSEQQRILLDRFHQGTEAGGLDCADCHSGPETGVLPYEELGFVPKRAQALRSDKLSATIEPGNKFFFPAFLKDEQPTVAPPEERADGNGTSEEDEVIKHDDHQKEEPLNWWQRRNEKRADEQKSG
jgi:hypothetical protein